MNGLARCVVSMFMLLIIAPGAFAATPVQIDTARNKALAWLIKTQNGDGNWKTTPGTEMLATTAGLDALNKAGLKGYPYAAGLSWLSNATAISNDSLARQIVSLYQAGMNVSALTARLITQRNDANRNWGALDEYEGSFPDTSLAMDALKISATAYADAGYGIGFIATRQNADGGWPYTKSEPGAATPKSWLIPTAYNLLTLNRYKTIYAVQTYINNGITWLKAQQKAGGGFGEGAAGTVHETALAYLAVVASLGATDAAALAAQDFLIAQQAVDGSWAANPYLTAMVLQTFPAPAPALADTDKDGIPDSVEAVLNTNPTVADSRWLASGNGQSLAGATAPQPLPQAVIGQPYTYALVVNSGVAPYAWSVASGALPPGLTLNASNGVIGGTPTVLGPASFEYAVKDASGQLRVAAAQIAVVDVPASAEIPTLSEWGVIIMGMLLVVSMVHLEKKRQSRQG
ncbi:MAG: putative Ig domain-containing protein [Pseudomonadota bacterium]